MTEYELFLKRYEEIDLIEDEDKQNDELSKLDKNIRKYVHKKYPELNYLYLEEISDDLIDDERQFIKGIISSQLNIYDILELVDIDRDQLIDMYLNSKE